MGKEGKVFVIGLSGISHFLQVEHFHRKGETVTAGSYFRETGGKGYNQAVAAAKLGAKVSFLSCVGKDKDGEVCQKILEEEGVCCFVCTKGLPTAFAFILTDSHGENQVTVWHGSADLLASEDVWELEQEICCSDIVLAQLECPEGALNAVRAITKKHGIPFILNPAPARPLEREEYYSTCILTPNLQEAELLFETDALRCGDYPGFARAVAKKKAECVIVTLGEKGALYVCGEEFQLYPAPQFLAKDTTGAGDTFNAALAVLLAEGASFPDAIRFAVKAASWSVTKRHVLESLPTREELLDLPLR